MDAKKEAIVSKLDELKGMVSEFKEEKAKEKAKTFETLTTAKVSLMSKHSPIDIWNNIVETLPKAGRWKIFLCSSNKSMTLPPFDFAVKNRITGLWARVDSKRDIFCLVTTSREAPISQFLIFTSLGKEDIPPSVESQGWTDLFDWNDISDLEIAREEFLKFVADPKMSMIA